MSYLLSVQTSTRGESDKSALALADELTTELQGASALVVATPMYNWGHQVH